MIFYYNGIKDNKGAKLQKCMYSRGRLLNHPEGTITIYGMNYRDFSPAVYAAFANHVHNNSDVMTDYFENDTIRVVPSHPLYAEVEAACALRDAKFDANQAKRKAKYDAKRAAAGLPVY